MKLLVLLLGGNNIGNYGLLNYFSRPTSGELQFDKAVLISTTKTSHFVEKFRQLKPELELEEINLAEDARNLSKIQRKVYEELKKLDPTFIHLNYTGGTKPMSVGTFLAVEQLEKEGVTARYSDISPDSSKLTFRNGETYPPAGSLTQYVKLTIEQLFMLHGIELKELTKSLPDSTPYHRHTAFQFMEAPRDEREKFADYYQRGGKWLEHLIFDILNSYINFFGLNDIALNVEGKLQKSKGNKTKNRRRRRKGKDENDFEIDVIAVKGYYPFIFSCKTSQDWPTIRGGAFEVFLRATQIGGITATPIIVGPYITPIRRKRLEETFKTYVGRSQLQIIGAEDLKSESNLVTRLAQIFGVN